MGAAMSAEEPGGTPFYDKFKKAFDDKDVDAIAACYTEDCQWVWHSTGKSMGKEAFVAMMPGFMKMPPSQKQRCLYENSEICLFHAFNKFPNGDVEGTMMMLKLRNGQCYLVETGSTVVPPGSPNYIE